MSQAGYTPIQLYYSTTAAATPSAGNLANGELAVNITDGKLFYKDNGGVVRVLATAAGSAGDVVGPGSSTDNALVRFDGTTGKLVQNSVGVLSDAGVLTGLTGLTSSGSITFSGLTSGRVTYAGTGGLLQDSANLTFDGTTLTANALTVSNAATLSGGTANGVTYLNGSKVLTTGGALTFDGTNLGVGTASPSYGVDVRGASGVGIQIFETSTGNNNRLILTQQATVSTYNSTFSTGSGAHAWQLGGSEQMRLNSTGLGIGTSSPENLLQASTRFGVSSSGIVRWGQTVTVSGRANSGYLTWDTGLVGLGYEGAGAIAFQTNSLERMRLDSSGNVGIGNSSPNALFVVGASQTRADSGVYAQISGGLEICATVAQDYRAQIETDSSTFYIGSNSYYSGGWNVYDTNRAPANITLTSESGNSYIAFRTSTSNSGYPAERARIDSSGNLLVGTTNTNPIGSNVAGIVGSPTGNLSISRDGAPSLDLNRYTSDGTIARFYRSATQVGSISVTTTATAYNTSSDYRLKENIQPMTGALAKVAALKPCTYKWKADGSDGEGFIAHELADVFPHAVTGEKDAVDEDGNPKYQGIDTSFLVATLTAAIQEQQTIINQLKARLDAANL